MGAYEYTALDRSGREQKGVLEVTPRARFASCCATSGLSPLAVAEVTQQSQGTAAARCSSAAPAPPTSR